MKKAFIKYLLGIALVTIVISGTLYLLSNFGLLLLPAATPGIIAFLTVSTVVVHAAFMFSSRQDGQSSVGLLMASILGHLVVNIIFILLLLYFNKEDAFKVTFIFFGSFIIYMIYEVVMISLFINSKSSE